MNLMRTVLTIAGSDSIGGAGIQADLKAIASLDLHGASALTAVTAQNTKRVAKIVPLSTKDVLSQIDAVFEDADVSAVKTGMLYSGDIASAVANRLKGENVPLVVDPVLIAGVGDKLCSSSLVSSLKKDLFPLATVVTPNRNEAEELASMTIDGPESTRAACEVISELGPKAVLIKGGHFEGDRVVDVLYCDNRVVELSAPRSANKVHGAGCTLASYIAGNISTGMDVRSAVLDAKRRITDAIELSYPIGGGMNAINPMASKQKDALKEERVDALRSAILDLEYALRTALVPDSGTEFVYALPAPQDLGEVCGIDGNISVRSRRPRRTGDITFNVSHGLAKVLLSVNRADHRMLSAITLCPTGKALMILKESGLSVKELERETENKGSVPSVGDMEKLMGQTGLVPDVIFDRSGMGVRPTMIVVGTSPADVLAKLRPILQ